MGTTEDLIYAYTRREAIEDGVLVDVSETAREAGFRFPVAVTQAVWDGYVVPDDRARQFGQSEAGRLWDVLSALRFAIRAAAGRSSICFKVIFIMGARQRRVVWLRAVCGPGDEGEPVITVMLPDED